MKIVRDTQFIDPSDQGASAAIGNFDGVHLGHQAVIDIARARAEQLNAPLGVMTFEPHPREFFAPETQPFRLMNADAKAHRLEKIGVEKLYELPFNSILSSLEADQFAQQIIMDSLALRHVVIGQDFCFGKGRKGTADDLRNFGDQMGFGVTIAEMVQMDMGEVSSTNIRAALSQGRPGDAAAMLGHWHRIEGQVIRGEQRGRELGYPTANMSISGLHPPKFGVYAVKIDVLAGANAGSYHGAASIGVRPMFGQNTANCETYLFDFKGDLYGAQISVGLVEFLRPELKFDTIDALITQMDADCAKAREILQNV
ncbi:bifunctional riboflavin kinase/FAD synthetase [Parasulfitobacter algicola]|uniref:Riboflavin biosynthesis protein n=1 Tax=Parasulfitobacter algicola TaxID=2614809 RepID=A0ABX2IXI6_9RHOB|nr:bifunctional riboflavin kinase/FAD synthetase [Sulfitobacter algicola]NSX55930.1 bifunctional riboflavin kinase/FAD synthetase [Sulfitobacter algicola]